MPKYADFVSFIEEFGKAPGNQVVGLSHNHETSHTVATYTTEWDKEDAPIDNPENSKKGRPRAYLAGYIHTAGSHLFPCTGIEVTDRKKPLNPDQAVIKGLLHHGQLFLDSHTGMLSLTPKGKIFLDKTGTDVVLSLPDPKADAARARYLALARPAQAQFRRAVMARFAHRCWVTGCAVPEALEAAHIRPFAQGGGPSLDMADNGLLLRRDVHALYDAGLLLVRSFSLQGPCMVELSDTLRDDPTYGELHGREINLPKESDTTDVRRRLRERARGVLQAAADNY